MRKIYVFLIIGLSFVFVYCSGNNFLKDAIDPVFPSSDSFSLEVVPSVVVLKRGNTGKFQLILRRIKGSSHSFAITVESNDGKIPFWFVPFRIYVKDVIRKDIKIKALYKDLESGEYTLKAEAVDSPENLILQQKFRLVKRGEREKEFPVACISYSPATVYKGNEVVFDGSSSYDPDGRIEKFKWKVNGQIVKEDSPTLEWKFLSPGFYTVTLEVLDNSGLSNSTAVLIEVLEI